MLKLQLQLFARAKNAKRKHEIQAFTGYDELTGLENAPNEDGWLRAAKYLTTITDNSTYNTETGGDYAGDGTPSTDVTSVSRIWTLTGTYDSTDPAQALLVEIGQDGVAGDDFLVWHRITFTNGKVVQGLATATEIRGGSGDATVYEEFNSVLSFKNTPEVVTPTPAG